MKRQHLDRLWAVVDIDGTISDCSKREHFQTKARACTDENERTMLLASFHAGCLDDPPHKAEVLLLHAWVIAGGRIVYLTGRPDYLRRQTQTWLQLNNLPDTPLIMRTTETGRTLDYKREQMAFIRDTLLVPGDKVSFVLEDRNDLVAQWREMGYTCLQPRHG